MLVGIFYEESQEVCKAFRERGHEAYSIDIQDCSGGHPEWHLKMDVKDAIRYKKWDFGGFHPVCTYLTVSNNNAMENGCSKYTAEEGRILREKAVQDFMMCVHSGIPKWYIENPIGIMSKRYRKPNQIIQPWMYGHGETKATCLWLRGLPRLNGFNVVKEREGKVWKMPPSEERTKLRSKTYPGIAFEMARQWG